MIEYLNVSVQLTANIGKLTKVDTLTASLNRYLANMEWCPAINNGI